MTRVRKARLTEEAWRRVFQLRCKSKQGQELGADDQALVNTAFVEDPQRYGAMDEDVFNATVPFGSGARWGK